MTVSLQALATPALKNQVAELIARDPAWRVLSYILGPRLWEYVHAVGPRDETLRSLAPAIAPLQLRQIVADPTEEVFLWTGAADLTNFLTLFERHGALREGASIFDFGCGCGRLSRLLDANPLYRAYASDINSVLVDWCRTHLRDVDTRLNGGAPPLPFEDASFDCAYSLSIFTHLSESNALAWLSEMARVVKRSGIFLFTVHGSTAIDTIQASEQHQKMFALDLDAIASIKNDIGAGGFRYVRYSPEVIAAANAGADYGNSFVAPQRVASWLGSDWEQVEYIPGGLRGWQDIVVLRKK